MENILSTILSDRFSISGDDIEKILKAVNLCLVSHLGDKLTVKDECQNLCEPMKAASIMVSGGIESFGISLAYSYCGLNRCKFLHKSYTIIGV